MDGGVRYYSNGIYVYATRIGKGAGDLVPCFLICTLPLNLFLVPQERTSLLH